jgi:hypothetical protein
MPDLKALAQALADDDADCPGGPGCLDHEVPVRPDVILALLAIRDAAAALDKVATWSALGRPEVAPLRAALAAYALTEGATDG